MQHHRRSGLLGRSARAADASFVPPQLRDFTFDIKNLLVGRTRSAHHPVNGQFELAPLQPLLQLGLGVFGHGLHLRVDLHTGKHTLNQTLGSLVARVQINGANQGFKRVGKYRRSFGAA